MNLPYSICNQRKRHGSGAVTSGRIEPSDAPRVLFIHGWGLGPRPFAPAIAKLRETGALVSAPDVSFVGDAWSCDRAAAKIVDRLDRSGWPDAALVGYSLGGAIAVRVAATAPTRVTHLVVVDSVGLPTGRSLLGWTTLFHRYARTCAPGVAWELLRHGNSPSGFANLARSAGYAIHADLTAELATVRTAGLRRTVIWGESDRLLPLTLGRQFASLLDTGLVVVPHADHDWPLRNPGTFAAVVADACTASSEPPGRCASGQIAS